MGGLWRKLPWTYVTMWVGAIRFQNFGLPTITRTGS